MPFHTIKHILKALLQGTMLVIIAGSPTLAQQNTGAKVDRIINKAMTDESIPGVAVAVIQNGKVLYQKTYGVRSVDNKVPTDANSVFSIGSVSKAFTAIGLMELVQQGKISMDAPIKTYMKTLPAAWQDITIRQFMTHTSGVPELKGEKDDDSFDKTVQKAGKLPMSFQPGKRQQYNNFNFAIMGKLIEIISGMDYLGYMQKNVFGPASMTTTGVKPATNDVTTGHMPGKNGLKAITTHFDAGDYGVPSGGLQTSLADFIQLTQALYKNTLISKATTQTMWTPYSGRLTNTPGWHSRMAGSTLVIHKGGGGTGIGSVCDFKIVPSQNIYIIMMFNKARNKISPDDVNDDILKQCFNIPKGAKGDNAGEGNEK